jgi:uncharacterized membrane protein
LAKGSVAVKPTVQSAGRYDLPVARRPDPDDEDGEVSPQLQSEVETLSAERLVFFSDAVVAIAITLLALELPVPQGITDSNHDWLVSARQNVDQYLAFVISFLVISAYWRGHHRVFRYLRNADPIVGLNLLWLFFIVITPFVTKVLSGNGAFQSRFILYASVQVLASLTFLTIIRVVRRYDLLREGSPPHLVRNTTIRMSGLALAFGISLPISLVTPWAYLCWVAIPVVTIALRRIADRFSPLQTIGAR